MQGSFFILSKLVSKLEDLKSVIKYKIMDKKYKWIKTPYNVKRIRSRRVKKCRGYKRIFYKYQSEFSSIIPECEYETEIIRLFNTLSAGIDQIEDPDELDKRWDEVEKLRNIGELVDRIKYIRIKHYGELIRNFIVKIKELDYYKDNINNNKRYDNIQRNWDKIICKNI